MVDAEVLRLYKSAPQMLDNPIPPWLNPDGLVLGAAITGGLLVLLGRSRRRKIQITRSNDF